MIKRILRSIKGRTNADAVYEWASTLTAEAVYWNEAALNNFFETQTVKRLRFKLAHIQRGSSGLIGLIGLQGSGKSATLQYLSTKLNSEYAKSPDAPTPWQISLGEASTCAMLIRWTPNALELLSNSEYVDSTYKGMVFTRASNKTLDKAKAGTRRTTYTELGEFDRGEPEEFGKAEELLGSTERKKAKFEATMDFLSRMRYLLIDLPDYSKKHKGDMTRDLRDLETLWKTLESGQIGEGGCPVFVIGIQKELYGGHFFFGKMDVVDVEPLKPSELVEAYRQRWQFFDVVSEDSLHYIAQLSRGVFRRFLKYIQRCIEETTFAKKGFPITIETVKTAITLEQIAKDMDLELADLFKSKDVKLSAVKLLTMLREQGEVNQKQIAEALDINEMAVTRMVKTLEANGYVKRKRGDRKEWLVTDGTSL